MTGLLIMLGVALGATALLMLSQWISRKFDVAGHALLVMTIILTIAGMAEGCQHLTKESQQHQESK